MFVKCEWCGKFFNRKPSHVLDHIFCSAKCYGKWWAQQHKGEKNPSWKGGKISKKCEICKKEMMLFPSQLSRRFCSLECKNKLASTRGGGRNPSEETRRKRSENARRRWANPKLREKWMNSLWKNLDFVKKVMKSWGAKPNKLEQQLIDLFQEKEFPFRFVGDGKVLIDGKIPDFISLDEKLIIELFGVHWHPQEEEEERRKFFKRHGYDCLIIWDNELKNEQEVVEKVWRFVNG